MVAPKRPIPETIPLYDTEYIPAQLIQDFWKVFVDFKFDPNRNTQMRPSGDDAVALYKRRLKDLKHDKLTAEVLRNIMTRYGFLERIRVGEQTYLKKFKKLNEIREAQRKSVAEYKRDVGDDIYSQAVKAMCQGYGYQSIAKRLNISENTIKAIYYSKPVQDLMKGIKEKAIKKTEAEIIEELMEENKQIKEQYTKLIPKLTQTVEDLQNKVQKYIDDPEAYDIPHETIFKESLKILKMYGEMTDQLTPKKEEKKGGQEEAYKLIIEMSQTNQFPNAQAEKLLEDKYQPPKLLE